MAPYLSVELRSDILLAAKASLLNYGVVNLPVLAEAIRVRNERENVALEDIEYELLTVASGLGASIEFDGPVRKPNGKLHDAGV